MRVSNNAICNAPRVNLPKGMFFNKTLGNGRYLEGFMLNAFPTLYNSGKLNWNLVRAQTKREYRK